MTNTLFDLEIPKNTDPIENLEITTTILYMSAQELKEFKTLAKEGIKRLYQADFQQKGNLTDYILHLMRNFANQKQAKNVYGDTTI